jgi:hypothetical protein
MSEHDSVQLGKSFKLVVNFLDQTKEVEFQQRKDGNWYWHGETEFCLEFSPKLLSVLQEQLESCDQLLELEPDSKCKYVIKILLKTKFIFICNFIFELREFNVSKSMASVDHSIALRTSHHCYFQRTVLISVKY